MTATRPGSYLLLMAAALGLMATEPAFADYTVTGRFQYQDREFNIDGFTGVTTPRPIRLAEVRIMAGSAELAKGATREDGTFSVTVSSSAAQQITAICVTTAPSATGMSLDVRVANDDYSFGDFYSVASASATASGSGTVDAGTTVASSDTDIGKAFNIWDVCADSMQFVASPNAAGAFPVPRLTAIWRANHPRSGAFYQNYGDSRYLFMSSVSAYDDTIIAHEFGHYIDSLYSKSDSPGGSHFIGDGNQDMRLSWGEGLATFLGSSIRKFKGYPSPEIYVNTDGSRLSFSYELESLTGNVAIGSRTGSSNEIAVSAALWDIVDGAAFYSSARDDDPLQRPWGDAWKVLAQYMPTVTRPGITIETFWDGWFSPALNNGALQDMQAVFNRLNGIEFVEDASEPDNAAGAARALPKAQRPALAPGSKVVINELDLGTVDALELYNSGSAEADLTGWTVESSAPGSATADWTLPSFRLAPGSFVVLSEASNANSGTILYFGSNISWANGRPGACALRNAAGQGVDFVRWGGSTEPVPGGTGFAGPDPDSPPTGRTLARSFGAGDTDAGVDWSAQATTFGTFNLSGQERHHTFYPAGDADFGAIDVPAGQSLLIETMNLANGADTIIDVLSADGATVLTSSDDFGTTKASRLAWTAPSSGRFLVRLRRFAGFSNFAQYGSFDVRVTESAASFAGLQPEILTVSQPGLGGRFESLAEAVAAANSGDTVQILDSGTYPGSLIVSGKNITLKAAPGKSPVIDGRDTGATATLRVLNAKSFRMEGIHILGAVRGIRIDSGSAVIANSVVAGARDPAGFADGIQVVGGGTDATIIHCTIVDNGRLGVGIFRDAAARIVNSIIDGNAMSQISGDGTAASLVVRNSLVPESSYIGSNGNIGGDPRFVGAAQGDFRLQAGSPAIDAGDGSDPELPGTDADGLPRSLPGKSGGLVAPDMGAFEYLAPGLLTSTAVFPQIAAGGTNPAYQTSIVGVNTGGTAANVTLSLTRSSAEPFPITALNGGSGATAAGTSPVEAASVYGNPGSQFNASIPPGGTVRIEAAGGNETASGYALLRSTSAVGGTALFKTIASDGESVLSEAGVGLSKPTKNFVIYIDNLNNALSGYAIANFGSSPANLTLTPRRSDGTALPPATIRLDPGRHVAEFFTANRFPTAGAGFEGAVEASSDQSVAAVALRYDNTHLDPSLHAFSTIPVLVDEAATTLYFPQVADGGTYRTNFILVNPTGNATTARLEFFASNGTPLSLSIGGALKTSHDLPISARGVARLITDGSGPGVRAGWVRVTCPVAIGGSAIFQTIGAGRILSQAGVGSSPRLAQFSVYVESLGSTESGLAICNPNPVPADVTLRLRNSAGQVIATATTNLPPLGHLAEFFTQRWFPSGFGEFEGTLEVLSNQPVSGVALRYDNPRQNVFATLPVIPW